MAEEKSAQSALCEPQSLEVKSSLLETKDKTKEFNDFNDLEPGLKSLVMRFSTAEGLANMASVSQEIKALSNEDCLWENLIQSSVSNPIESKEEKKQSAKDIFKDFPEQRLPEFYLKVKGDRGANLCRAVLRRNPQDIDAKSRLAFLIAMGEASRTSEDSEAFVAPGVVIANIWGQNQTHTESQFYLAKLTALDTHQRAVLNSAGQYRIILERNPNHTDALYEMARFTEQGKLPLICTDFLFPNLPPSPYPFSPNTPGHGLALRNRVCLLYQKILAIDPWHEDALYGLADIMEEAVVQINPEEFRQYAALIDKPRVLPNPRITLNLQLAAILYRRILAVNPKHPGAACNLAGLIGEGSVLAQTHDFLEEEKRVSMPCNLLDQEFILYNRIHGSNREAKLKYDNALLQKQKKVILHSIPNNMWPEYLRADISNFENLTKTQRNLLTAAIIRAEKDHNSIAAVIHRSDERSLSISNKTYYNLLIFSTVFMLGNTPFIFLYIEANQLNEIWRSLGFSGIAGLHALFLAMTLYLSNKSYNKIYSEAHEEGRREELLELQQRIVTTIVSDNASMQSLFPKLSWEQEGAIYRRLWEIPQAKWGQTQKIAFIEGFYQSAPEERRSLIQAIQSVDVLNWTDLSRYKKVKIAQTTEFAVQVLPFLALFTAGSYAMYKTYAALDEIAEQGVALGAEGLGLMVVAGLVYALGKIIFLDVKWVETARESVREDLIMEEINSAPEPQNNP